MMMNKRIFSALLSLAGSVALSLAVSVTVLQQPALGDTWNLPSVLNDSNTKVSFVVDSTWHTIHGITKNLNGAIALRDKADPLSIAVDLKIQVRTFDTDWDSRDEDLQECMASDTFPLATFTSTRLSDSCKPVIIDIAGKCSGTLTGTLTMRDVSKEVALPVTIVKGQDSYLISGALPVAWAEYNIEDPSILIAKLDPIVTISYETKVPLKH
ncbi:MAG: Protein YceI [Pseudomonadota bacterium]|jgi:polyisoprenoid-binding protein YceI